jgi:hypothetical protein
MPGFSPAECPREVAGLYPPTVSVSALTECPETILDGMRDYRSRIEPWLRRFSHVRIRMHILDCAPEREQGPHCGEMANRCRTVDRGPILDASLEGPIFLLVEQGVYRCNSLKCRARQRRPRALGVKGKEGGPCYFRKRLPFTRLRGRYTNRARRLGIDSVKLDGMPFTKVAVRMAREFHLRTVARATLWRWHKAEGDQARAEVDYLQFSKESLSGVVCLDEMYDGEFVLLVATDPLNKMTLGFQVLEGKSVASDQVAEFMRYLAHKGIDPDIVVTDESKLYPPALKEVWAGARHQICVFHVLRHFMGFVLDSVRAYVKGLPQDPKRGRGRPRKGEVRANHKGRRQAAWDRRYLVVRGLDADDEVKQNLASLLEEHPGLGVARDFMESIYRMVAPDVTRKDAEEIRRQILADPRFQADKFLQKGVKKLTSDSQFQKLIAFTDYSNLNRTNNSTERHNRGTRKKQKSHYRLRRLDTLANALALAVQEERRLLGAAPSPKLEPRGAPTDEGAQAPDA